MSVVQSHEDDGVLLLLLSLFVIVIIPAKDAQFQLDKVDKKYKKIFCLLEFYKFY